VKGGAAAKDTTTSASFAGKQGTTEVNTTWRLGAPPTGTPQPIAAGFMLLIDCLPTFPVQDASELVEPLLEQIVAETKLDQFDPGPKCWQSISYNKAGGLLHHALLRVRQDWAGFIRVDTSHPLAGTIIAALEPVATGVIRGVR
jgi:hypothetical protein